MSVRNNGNGAYTVTYSNFGPGAGPLGITFSAGPNTPGTYDINGGSFVFGAPEPVTWVLMAVGFVVMGAMLRRRSRLARQTA